MSANRYLALAVLHEQIGGKVLDKVVGVVSQRLTVESVEESVAGAVGGGAASVCLATLSVLLGLTSKGSLVTRT